MKRPLPSLFLALCCFSITQAQPTSEPIAIGQPAANERIIRYALTPSVVLSFGKEPILLEVTTEGNPTEVRLTFGNTTQPEQSLNDRGIDGDKKAGDGVFSAVVAPRLEWMYPFLGHIRAYAGTVKVAEVVGIVILSLSDAPPIIPRKIDSTTQYSDYVFNIVVPSTARSLTEADWLKYSQLFYNYHADEFDFINYVLTPGFVGPVSHTIVANNVTAVGLPIVNNSAKFGSMGRLKGLIQFPIPDQFDGAGRPLVQAIGRQWIRPNNPLLQVGVPNWPVSNLATGVMGIGEEGKAFPVEFYESGNGNYGLNPIFNTLYGMAQVSPTPRVHSTVFNDWELYLMGLLPPDQVQTNAIVFNNQNITLSFPYGGQYPKSGFSTYLFADRVAEVGARVPVAAQSQKQFSMATIVLSERLLNATEMSYLNYMAKRAEGRETVQTREGFTPVAGRPFYVATHGRATLRTLLNTTVNCTQAPAQPTITASLGTSLCLGHITVLTTSLPESLTPIWYHNGSPLPDRTTSITAVYTGDYTLSVRDEKGCSSAVSPVLSLSVLVSPVKPKVAFFGNDVATSCAPGSLFTNERIPLYQWFLDGKPLEGATRYAFYPRASGAYTVAIRQPNGCTDIVSDPVSITARTNGTSAELTADKTEFTCGGPAITLRATTDAKNPKQWFWSRNSEYIAQTTSATYSATATGAYTVQVFGEENCPGSLSKPVSLTPGVTPTKPTISTTASGLLSSSPVNNQWIIFGTPDYYNRGQTYSTPYNGLYYIVRVNKGGCLIDSDPFLYEGISITTAPQPGTVTNPPVNTATVTNPPTNTATAPQVITAYDPALPGSLSLRHAPNPVNQSAQIWFDLPIITHITLRLLNSNGSAVRILAEGRYQAGTHTIMLDMSGLPSGLYLYRLEAEGVSRTNKLLVMK